MPFQEQAVNFLIGWQFSSSVRRSRSIRPVCLNYSHINRARTRKKILLQLQEGYMQVAEWNDAVSRVVGLFMKLIQPRTTLVGELRVELFQASNKA